MSEEPHGDRKRVFVYTRISTEAQTDGGGIARQLEVCSNFCEKQGWVILRNFEEQESGGVLAFERPALSELVSLCGDAYGVRTIVMERPDRIARDVLVNELFFRECKKLGIEVYAADCGQELVNADGDPSRTLIRQLFAAVSEFNKWEIARKLQDGRRRTKEKTGWPCGGPLAFGRRPGEDIWVRRILFYHRLGWKATAICRLINYQPQWRPTRPKFFSRSTVYDIIETWNHRPEYSGKITLDSIVET